MTLPDSNSGTRAENTDFERPAQCSASGYCYSDTFYRYIASGSLRSAKVVVPLVLRELSPLSVLDVGCGAGAWLSEYRDRGIADYLGVDGAYVQRGSLLISAEKFQTQDVAQEFDLGRQFDIVQCLEVGEHLPMASSRTLVENLTKHGRRILFSAATPGQGGENHINEKTLEFWRLLFAERNYRPFDLFRPTIKRMSVVESWYRRNIMLYVAEAEIPALPPSVLCSHIPDGEAIHDVISWVDKIQFRVLLLLPTRWVSKIALAKHRIVIACRRLRNG